MLIKYPFTEKDEYILKELTKAGWGWEKYAQSVIKQGDISLAQQETIRSMLGRLRKQQANNRGVVYDDEDDISDSEAMSFGEYF